jgi:hypothetical protein
VAVQEFFFSLEFSSQAAPAALLDDLAARVLAYVGLDDNAGKKLPGFSDALKQAATTSTTSTVGGASRCDVQFRVQGPKLEVVVTVNGGRTWQASRAIP